MSAPGPDRPPDPHRPPLHALDAYHAATINQLDLFTRIVWPKLAAEESDQTRRWWEASTRLTQLALSDPAAGLPRLAQLTAHLLLEHAQQHNPKEQP